MLRASDSVEENAKRHALLSLEVCKRDLHGLVDRFESVELHVGNDVLLDGRVAQDARLQVSSDATELV